MHVNLLPNGFSLFHHEFPDQSFAECESGPTGKANFTHTFVHNSISCQADYRSFPSWRASAESGAALSCCSTFNGFRPAQLNVSLPFHMRLLRAISSPTIWPAPCDFASVHRGEPER
jgi:hypothetical protein